MTVEGFSGGYIVGSIAKMFADITQPDGTLFYDPTADISEDLRSADYDPDVPTLVTWRPAISNGFATENAKFFRSPIDSSPLGILQFFSQGYACYEEFWKHNFQRFGVYVYWLQTGGVPYGTSTPIDPGGEVDDIIAPAGYPSTYADSLAIAVQYGIIEGTQLEVNYICVNESFEEDSVLLTNLPIGNFGGT